MACSLIGANEAWDALPPRVSCPVTQYPEQNGGEAERRIARQFAGRVLGTTRRVIAAALILVAVASSGVARLEFSANYRRLR